MKLARKKKVAGHKTSFRKRYASDGKGMEPNPCTHRWPGPWEGFRPDQSTTKAVLKRYEAWKAAQ